VRHGRSAQDHVFLRQAISVDEAMQVGKQGVGMGYVICRHPAGFFRIS
jgi:hypothetical protein